MSTPAYITGEVITWARKRVGISTNELANLLHVGAANLEAWERESERPSFNKAEALAKHLRIPFGYLFLSKKPTLDIPIPDLRTQSGARPSNPSLNFLEAVQSALLRQQWFSDYQKETKRPKLPFVGTARLGEDIKHLASDMRRHLGITHKMREQCRSWEDFKTQFVRSAEDIGVMVMRSGVGITNRRPLTVKEFRGFAIIDAFAPAVFINSRDAKAAQIFTLAHELVHIWLGESGISNPDPMKRSSEDTNKIERYCNRVAAEFLVPSEGVEQMWETNQTIDRNVQRLVAYYRVSKFVVARQVFEMDRITRADYLAYLERNPSLWKPKEKGEEDEGGGDFYATFAARHGRTLISGVLRALGEDRISFRDASSLLSVKVGTLTKVADRFS